MGGALSLEVLPGRVEASRWEALYDDSLRALEAHPCQPAGLRVERGRRTLSARLEQGPPDHRWWCVVGDLTSLRTGEPCVMHRRPPGAGAGARAGAVADILGARDRLVALEAHTGGHPYQGAALAAIAVFEDGLPHVALVRGDFDAEQARAACLLASATLGRPIQTPVVTRPAALLTRLGAFHRGLSLIEHALLLNRAPRTEALAALRDTLPTDTLERWLLRRLRHAPTPDGPALRRALDDGLALGFTPDTLQHLACRHPHGPRLSPRLLGPATPPPSNAPPPSRPPSKPRSSSPPPSPEAPSLPEPDALLTVPGLDALEPTARLYLRLAASAALAPEHPIDQKLLQGSADAMRAHLLQAAEVRAVMLTEAAWVTLETLDDPATLRLALAVTLSDRPALAALRRPLLENAALRAGLAALAADPTHAANARRWWASLGRLGGHAGTR